MIHIQTLQEVSDLLPWLPLALWLISFSIFHTRYRQAPLRGHWNRVCSLVLISKRLLTHPCRWGEFEIQIRVTFIADSGEKAIHFFHHLKLHPWTVVGSGEPEIPSPETAAKAGPVHSWQYDEIVFNDPFQPFLNILMEHPPTPLPRAKNRPAPFHTANPASIADTKNGVPEFSAAMVQEEAERLEVARKTVIAQQDKWRTELIERENELAALKKQLPS